MSKKVDNVHERRKLVEAFFHDSGSFFPLKEVEKLVAKKTQLRSDTVLEVLEDLVNDNLVHKEKIGLQNIYWSFVSDARRSRAKRAADQVVARTTQLELRRTLEDKLASGRQERMSSSHRDELQRTVNAKEIALAAKRKEFSKVSDSDPFILDAKVLCAQRALQAAQRYQDNKLLLREYIQERGFQGDFFETFGIESKDTSESGATGNVCASGRLS